MKLHSNIFGWECVWEEFAAEKSGEAVLDQDGHVTMLRIPMPEHDATMFITPTSHGSAAAVHYSPAGNFVMHLFVKKLIHKLEKAFGLQDLTIGDKSFDGRFVSQSNLPDKLKEIFGDASLCQAILSEGVAELSIIPYYAGIDERWAVPSDHDVVIYCQDALMEKFDQLNASFEILSRLLTKLKDCGIVGSTAADVPEMAVPALGHGRLHSPLLGI